MRPLEAVSIVAVLSLLSVPALADHFPRQAGQMWGKSQTFDGIGNSPNPDKFEQKGDAFFSDQVPGGWNSYAGQSASSGRWKAFGIYNGRGYPGRKRAEEAGEFWGGGAGGGFGTGGPGSDRDR